MLERSNPLWYWGAEKHNHNHMYAEDLRNAPISVSTSGDNTIIAAPSDGYIAIDHINFIPTTAVAVKFKSGASDDLSGTYPLDAKQPITLENTTKHVKGIITCDRNKAFVINLGGAVAINGFVRYRVVGNS